MTQIATVEERLRPGLVRIAVAERACDTPRNCMAKVATSFWMSASESRRS